MSGFVYAIEAPDGLIKLGFTKNLAKRLAGLRTANQGELRPLGYIEATPAQELELHALLRGSREYGEWFRPSRLVMHAVEMMKPWPSSFRKPIGTHPLTRYRRAKRLSGEKLAAALGVRRETLWRWEKRARFPGRKHWPRIREVTGIGTAELAETEAQ